jgi:nitrogen regulatory protein PII
MELAKRTMVSIICESVIERYLLEDLKKLGAHGYTIIEVRGGGAHGTRDAEGEQDRNIQVEVICERSTAETILEHLQQHYFSNYFMIAYLAEVEVIRPNKF